MLSQKLNLVLTNLKKDVLMKKYFIWFWLLLKREFHHYFTVLFLLLLPLCTFLATHFSSANESGIPRVGLIVTDDDFLALEACDTLINSQSDAVSFYMADSKDELKASILSGKTDCGYVFKENLYERLSNHRLKNSIVAYNSPASIVSSLSNEMVFSAVFCSFSKPHAIDFANSDELLSKYNDNNEFISKRYDYYINGAATFHVEFKSLEANLDNIEVKATTFPLRGVLSLLILISAMMGSVRFMMDNENGIFISRPQAFVIYCRIMYVFIPCVLFSTSSLVCLYISGNTLNIGTEILALLLYAALVFTLSIIATLILRKSFILIAIIPIMVIGCLLICPIFIDLSNLLPFVKFVKRLLPPYYYINYFM